MRRQERATEDLLRDLSRLKVEGPSRGGPHVGVRHNAVTEALFAKGNAVIPVLIERLHDAGWDEAVYLVFLLRELHAKEAKSAIEALNRSGLAQSAGRDLTLAMQLQYFLRDVNTW
jgi:hypothetical protein